MRIIKVQNSQSGIKSAKEILYKKSDKNTVLFLSGGSTPAPLYKILANEKKLKVGAVAMIDDRYSLHEQYSNEFMIRGSGLVQFIERKKGAFFPILEYGLSLPETAEKYNEMLRFLFNKFPKRVAILGIGTDGHTASLPPKDSKLKVNNLEFVSFTRSFGTDPKVPRISLNMNSLSLMDFLIVIVFGEDKKEGIKKALKTFFKGSLSKKTILITNNPII